MRPEWVAVVAAIVGGARPGRRHLAGWQEDGSDVVKAIAVGLEALKISGSAPLNLPLPLCSAWTAYWQVVTGSGPSWRSSEGQMPAR